MRSPVRRLTLPLIGQPASGGPTCGSDAKQKQSENCCDDWLGLVGDDHHKYACDQAVM
jgi:hypothetical protein